MTKQTKMIIAVGAVALGGYLLYKRSKSFANLTAPIGLGGMPKECLALAGQTVTSGKCQCPCKNVVAETKDGTQFCQNGHSCCTKTGKVGACINEDNN